MLVLLLYRQHATGTDRSVTLMLWCQVTVIVVDEFPPTPPPSWVYFMKTRVDNLKMRSTTSWWRVSKDVSALTDLLNASVLVDVGETVTVTTR